MLIGITFLVSTSIETSSQSSELSFSPISFGMFKFCDIVDVGNPSVKVLANANQSISPGESIKKLMMINEERAYFIHAGHNFLGTKQPLQIQIIDTDQVVVYDQVIKPRKHILFTPEKTGQYFLTITNAGEKHDSPWVMYGHVLTEEESEHTFISGCPTKEEPDPVKWSLKLVLPDDLIDKVSMPDWVTKNMQWIKDEKISRKEFRLGFQYLIEKGIIQIDCTQCTDVSLDKDNHIEVTGTLVHHSNVDGGWFSLKPDSGIKYKIRNFPHDFVQVWANFTPEQSGERVIIQGTFTTDFEKYLLQQQAAIIPGTPIRNPTVIVEDFQLLN